MGFSYDEIIAGIDEFSDSFGFLPVFWDSLFNDSLDALEFEVIICPQIDEQSLITGTESRRFLDKVKRTLDTSGKATPAESEEPAREMRRSLGAKADNKQAKEDIKAADANFKPVSDRMEFVEYPRFERTLRNVVNWGKAIHEAVYDLLQRYREFEALFVKLSAASTRAAAQAEQLNRTQTHNVDYLNRLSQEEAREEVVTYSKATGSIDTSFQVLSLVDRISRTMQEFCNAHLFANPASRSSVCDVNLFGIEQNSEDFADFLLQISLQLDVVLQEATKSYFEVGYGVRFNSFDDELLDVTEMVDMEAFEEGGYRQFSFARSGPPPAATNGQNISSTSISDLRNGPYFCKFDNIGMTSFGVIFVDENEEIVASSDDDIDVSITLSSPFYKMSDGVRYAYSLQGYEDVVYRYSSPRVVDAQYFCRTDERPSLFGTLCDKGRGFEIKEDGLNTQPLPTPYAQWDVEVTQGRKSLAAEGAVGVKIMTSFNAVRNDEMLCRSERLQYLASVTSAGSSTGTADPSEASTVALASILGLLVGCAALFVGYRLRKSDNELIAVNATDNPRSSQAMTREALERIEEKVPTIEEAITTT